MMKEILPKLCSSPMMYGNFVWDRKTRFHSFIITEHTSDTEYIKRTIAEMLSIGSCSFFFYGEYSDDWEAAANEAAAGQEITIKVCEYEIDFAQALYDCFSVDEEPVCEIALIYDEDVTYRWIVRKIEWFMQQDKMFHVVRMCLDELNPYGLLPEAPADEFYGEAGRIVDLLRPGDTVETVAGKMAAVLRQAFDLTFTTEMCIEYAVRIVDSMNEETGE